MSVRIRSNLGGLVAATNRSAVIPNIRPQIGKVFGVITTLNTPTKELFEKWGGYSGVGTIFYLDYNQSANTNNVDLNTCKVAKPFLTNTQNYPLIGELVQITDAPSAASQLSTSNASQKYYTGTVNIWNDVQQNSPSPGILGKTFTESADIRKLLYFEGDIINQGRKGNGIRFGSTVKSLSSENEWSTVGNNGDPITIMVNGYVTTDTGSLSPNIEEINKEMSSIYMTSTQSIPLIPGAIIKNPLNPSYEPRNYYSSQIILNSDRITLNSKKDEVLLFAKTNIELNTDNIINLNAGKVIHLNIEGTNKDSKILLGTKSNGEVPSSPVLLGDQTSILFEKLVFTLQNLAYYLSVATSNPEGGSIVSLQNAGTQLYSDINGLCDQLNKCLSTKVFTV